MKKTIKFQEYIKVWQECVAEIECPEGETDQMTFNRLRREGIDKSGEYELTSILYESEQEIASECGLFERTLDFEGSDACGVIARDGVSCDPKFAIEDENKEFPAAMSQTLKVRFTWGDQHENLTLEYDARDTEMDRDDFLDNEYDNWVDSLRGSWELDPRPISIYDALTHKLADEESALRIITCPHGLEVHVKRGSDNIGTIVDIFGGCNSEHLFATLPYWDDDIKLEEGDEEEDEDEPFQGYSGYDHHG